jgi:glycosyltransferase involved in cell wall biosynthesis
VLHVAPMVSTADGTSLAVLAMIRALNQDPDIKVELLVGEYDGYSPHPGLLDSGSVPVHTLAVMQPLGGRLGNMVGYPRDFRKTLAHLATQVDLVHLHGLWLYPTLLGCPILRSLRKPYVVSLHGSLMIDALRRSQLKKRIALALFERRNIESASAVLATSAAELEQLRHLGVSIRGTLIPLAVGPDAMRFFAGERTLEAFVARRARTLLCVSRFHSHKQLVELVHAFADVAGATPEWSLRIVGPDDEPGYRARVVAAAGQTGFARRISVESALEGEHLWEAYREADLFVLASTSENFGLVIGEALASGLPVIATRGTPWQQLLSHRCGWLIDPALRSLRPTLRAAMSTAPADLWEMGRRGASLIRKEFSLQALGRGLGGVYRAICQ